MCRKPVELGAKIGGMKELEDRPTGREQVGEERSDDMWDRFVQELGGSED